MEIARPKIIWRLPDNNRKKLYGTITLYSKAFSRQLDYSEIEGAVPFKIVHLGVFFEPKASIRIRPMKENV